MIANRFSTATSGDTDVAGTLSIVAPRGLYAVPFESKAKKNPDELLPAAPADRGSGIRLTKRENGKEDDIINRPGRSTYLEEKSVLTSGATSHDQRPFSLGFSLVAADCRTQADGSRLIE